MYVWVWEYVAQFVQYVLGKVYSLPVAYIEHVVVDAPAGRPYRMRCLGGAAELGICRHGRLEVTWHIDFRKYVYVSFGTVADNLLHVFPGVVIWPVCLARVARLACVIFRRAGRVERVGTEIGIPAV